VVDSSDPIAWNAVPAVGFSTRPVRVFPVPSQPFRLAAADVTSQGWMAVGSPVEVGRLSMLARGLQVWTRRLVYGTGGQTMP
jgi:hypothetical protein